MSPEVQATTQPEDQDKLLIVAIEDGTNTVVLDPDEALEVYLKLGELLADVGLLQSVNGHERQSSG